MKRIKLIFVLALVLVLVTACGGGGNETNAGNSQNGNTNEPAQNNQNEDAGPEVTVPEVEGDTLSANLFFDPSMVAMDDNDSLFAASLVYEGLMTLDADGNVVPGIARSVEVSVDGISYEFHLRPDAVFSNGDVIDADVIMANFNRWFDPNNELHGTDSSVYQAWVFYFEGFRIDDAEDAPESLFDGIERIDNLTVLVQLFEPMPNFLEIIASPHFSILNPAALGGDYGAMGSGITGSGPYEIGSWTDGEIIFDPSASYWGELPSESMTFGLD